MTNTELQYKESWKGEYRGMQFEIVHWQLGWNYYLYIPVEQLPKGIKSKFNLHSRTFRLSSDSSKHIIFNYSSAPIISDLDWHGGITLYEKKRGEDNVVKGYRLGCDYAHLWDKNKQYNLDCVVKEAQHSIDKLWELVPDLKLQCAWDGKFYKKDQVYYTDKNVCVSLENREKWNKTLRLVVEE